MNLNNNRYNSKKFDKEIYKKEQIQNENISNYLLTKNHNVKNNCYQDNPEIRNQLLSELKKVDVETKLFGIDRKEICDNFHTCNEKLCNTQKFDKLTTPIDECNLDTIHSRYFTNNIKEMGINRWENLKYNPQNYAIGDVTNQISSRTLIKDNYKMLNITPENHTNELEYDDKLPIKKTTSVNIIPDFN